MSINLSRIKLMSCHNFFEYQIDILQLFREPIYGFTLFFFFFFPFFFPDLTVEIKAQLFNRSQAGFCFFTTPEFQHIVMFLHSSGTSVWNVRQS